jgi:hypothetical protein
MIPFIDLYDALTSEKNKTILSQLEVDGIHLDQSIQKIIYKCETVHHCGLDLHKLREHNYKAIGFACLDFKGTFCKIILT